MLVPSSKTIDGLKVHTTPLPARAANRLLVRLSGHVMPVVGALVAGVKGGKLPPDGEVVEFLDRDVDADALAQIGTALQAACSKLTEDEVDIIFDRALASTTVEMPDGLTGLEGAHFDRVFTGRPATSWKVLGFALVENFRDFFGGALGEALAGLKTAAVKKATRLASGRG